MLKNLLLGNMVVFLLLAASQVHAYTMVDSSDPSCAPAFIDISGTGTAAVWEGGGGYPGDDDEENLTLPFSFLFYDTLSSAVRISTNGGILFGATSGALPYTNADIPTNSPARTILPFWDDLNPNQGGNVYWEVQGSAPNRRFIVQWDNVPHYPNVGDATLQVVLYEGTNNIFFIYNDVNFGNNAYNNGQSATIGLNNNAVEADRYSYNSPSLNGINSICFFPNDFGDAPASYGDAWHYTLADQPPYLGSVAPDIEHDMLNSSDALLDNTTGSNDEEGVAFRSPAGTNQSIFADVTINNPTGNSVTVCGWLDIPSGGAVDGSFDAGDGQCQTTNASTITFQWSNLPDDQQYSTYARFRVSSNSLTASDATGYAFDGEVEDYQVRFDFRPTAVTIGQVTLETTLVQNFLTGLNIEKIDRDRLLALLAIWDPETAATLVQPDREQIVNALRDYLDPDGDGQVAVLQWDTLEERGTIGFFVQRAAGNNHWILINNDMLPGLINAPMGGQYQLADPAARSGQVYQYRLIEQEADGHTQLYGPYILEMK